MGQFEYLTNRGGNVPSSNTSMSQNNNNQKSFRKNRTTRAAKQVAAKVIKAVAPQVAQPQRRRRKRNRGGGGGGGLLSTLAGVASSFLPGVAKFVGSTVANVMGRGDYVVAGQGISQNSLLTANTPPTFAGADKGTVVAHREYIRDITTGPTLTNGASDFSYSTFDLNPGMPGTFAWLSNVARNFEEYEFLGMLFEYKSTSSNALSSLNTALGTVILSTQYNTINPPFGSKMQQENYQFAQSIKPAESGIHAVECARGQNVLNRLYVRTGPVPADSDQRMYDLGEFQISTVGMQAANVVIGELWVTYHVALYKPRIPQAITNPVLSAKFYSASGNATFPMGSSPTIQLPLSGSTLTLSKILVDTSANTTTFYFPPAVDSGIFLCLYTVSMDINTTYRPASFSSLINCTQSAGGWTTGSPYQICWTLVTVTSPGASFRLTGTVGLNLLNPCVYVTQYAAGTPQGKLSIQETELVKRYAYKLAKLAGTTIDASKFFSGDDNVALGEEQEEEEQEISFHEDREPRKLRKATAESVEILENLPADDLKDITEFMKRPEVMKEVRLLLQGIKPT